MRRNASAIHPAPRAWSVTAGRFAGASHVSVSAQLYPWGAYVLDMDGDTLMHGFDEQWRWPVQHSQEPLPFQGRGLTDLAELSRALTIFKPAARRRTDEAVPLFLASPDAADVAALIVQRTVARRTNQLWRSDRWIRRLDAVLSLRWPPASRGEGRRRCSVLRVRLGGRLTNESFHFDKERLRCDGLYKDRIRSGFSRAVHLGFPDICRQHENRHAVHLRITSEQFAQLKTVQDGQARLGNHQGRTMG